MKSYIATARGFANGKVIEEGEPFEYAGKPGSWMEAVDGKAKKPKAEKAEQAEAPASGTANADVI